ncbi:MAG: chromosome segregation protein SMC [Planctomycetota bacterium]|nr:chromosome segregation protein SMC [Planctomycetota bacterium]
MLKALELIGFKSFADRTRFDFPPGITVVVGPNGSGKSNIVDAIKWVLGEQSVKSLRGKEMADVIFKGLGSGRKMMNAAEATIIFDNSEERLGVDAPEVHVTRRVYRSGEAEYLINGEPCRLKDVRNLFRGTGVGTDAYSLIEQGKVDQLLQASPRDRRAIFEEAAGISRFKAKKIEAQRRLERVDQNLLRLRDIVDEVENRLRNVRNQASKARRYREYTERLQQLRTQVAMTDWRRLNEQLSGVDEELQELRSQARQTNQEAQDAESAIATVDQEVISVDAEIRDREEVASRNRERIATQQSVQTHRRADCVDLEAEIARCREQLSAMMTRAGDVEQRARQTRQELAEAATEREHAAQRLEDDEARFDGHIQQLEFMRGENDQRRGHHVELMRQAATSGTELGNLESQIESLQKSCRQGERQLADIGSASQKTAEECAHSREQQESLGERLDRLDQELVVAERELWESRHALNGRKEDLSMRHGRLSGIRERTSLLEDLEKRREGIGDGVTQVLALAEREGEGPWTEIRGLLVDLLRVKLEDAPLIDTALGDRSQSVVVAGQHILLELASGLLKVNGRVGLVPTTDYFEEVGNTESEDNTSHSTEPAAHEVMLRSHPEVVGRADTFVDVDPEYVPLVERLLGTTWFVQTLEGARELHRATQGAMRFVTPAAELVDHDGSILLGPRRTSAGLVSRKSELRALRQEFVVLQQRMEEAQQEIGRLQESIRSQERQVKNLSDRQQLTMAELAERRAVTRALEERAEQLSDQGEAVGVELAASRTQHQHASQRRQELRQRLDQLESDMELVADSIQAGDDSIKVVEQERLGALKVATAARVELAKIEQRQDALRARMSQFEEDRAERTHSLDQARSQWSVAQRRKRESERAILMATTQLAEWFLAKESLETGIAQELGKRQELHSRRDVLSGDLQRYQKENRSLEERSHQVDLLAGKLRHERDTVVDRLKEDYGIELESVTDETSEEEQQREEVEREIEDLRRKINQIGAVNMEALGELDDLESRFNTLSGQYNDISQAKESLERIIQKINADSRRLFMETLEAIRANFHALYRKAFGGGKADLVLDDDVDVLEAGVEIVATPPGKPSFNNSLLSGGEKALTAVALLLAIFQFRPSPFCVLDEVDAPFDEANIGRFVDVLHGFLGWTKFVIVTHSKKTMTAATTLYGVTMQESGVSKRVSVRFEDVSEDGSISEEALERSTTEEEPAGDDERGAA